MRRRSLSKNDTANKAALPEAAEAADLGGVDGAIHVERVKLARRRGWASLSILCLLGCGTSEFASDLQYGMDATVDGSVIEGGGMDAAPPGCDASMDPKDSPACVDDSFGIFVSPMGSDGAAGTKLAPLQTITAALGKTSATKNRVYICEGTYAEAVTLSAAANLYGGFDCGSWSYATKSVKVAPATAGVALTISKVADAISIEDMEFDALPGTVQFVSSIAAFANASPSVTMKRVKLVTGAGHQGADGATNLAVVPQGAKGNNADGGAGGGPDKICPCPDGMTIGGHGGSFSPGLFFGGPGSPDLHGTAPKDGAGGTGSLTSCGATGPGHDGPDGDAGVVGGSASLLGDIDDSGFHAKSGLAGGNGVRGEGAGGGGATTAGISGAGGGGCGGCGGAGGGSGSGGGASAALLTLASPVQLVACSLVADIAANGGKGGDGQTGGAGGFSGNDPVGASCNGGIGGHGGTGAPGGGGAGGISAGVIAKGAPPVLDAMTLAAVTTKAKGTGGDPGTGGGSKGIDGVSQPTVSIP